MDTNPTSPHSSGLERSCDESTDDWLRAQTPAAGIALLEARFQGRAYRRHRHDTYAIGLTESGVQSFFYRGTVHFSLPGEVVVLHPDELHDGYAGTAAGFSYRLIYIDPAQIGEATRELRGPEAALPFVAQP